MANKKPRRKKRSGTSRSKKEPATTRSRANVLGKKPTRVLVVGDWFVDDHWVAGTYRSSTSSRTGDRHLAALQGKHSATESLCGAGRTASVLHGAGFTICGVGICAAEDQKVLLSLLEPASLAERNPHTLRRWSEATTPKGAEFCNLGTADCGTSRAIRIHERVGAITRLTNRFDWETEVPAKLRLDALKRFVQRHDIDAVIIKDLAKGLVSKTLIEVVAEALADKPWFVSTKRWLPPWLSLLRDVDLRLFVVPEMAAQSALGSAIDDDKEVRRTLKAWMVGGRRRPSKGALAVLENRILREIRNSTHRARWPLVVVVSEASAVMAFDAKGQGFVHEVTASREAVPMPLSSVLLGALTGRLLAHSGGTIAEIVEGAVAYTEHWREFEGRRVTHYRTWEPKTEPRDELLLGRSQDIFSWRAMAEEWKDAYTTLLGVVGPEDDRRLELWRGMTELPNYVCIVRSKRRSVSALVEMARAFVSARRATIESCMLVAPPGAGKTQLARSLADHSGLQILPFNISQLFRPEDILDCFDQISTTQAQLSGKGLLVFFDEINAKLEGEPVYAPFLSPLEEGYYLRGEKAFRIEPCVWLFAGTELDPQASKAPDFEARLSRGQVSLELPANDPESDSSNLERVYLGALLLKRSFEELEYVSEDVLDLFRSLPGGFTNRQLADFARRFKDVRGRKVSRENIPWRWLEDRLRHNKTKFPKKQWENHWRQNTSRSKGGSTPCDVKLVEEPI